MRVKIYVEGGGDRARLKRECRRAFSKFFERAGFKGRMPKIVACGSRNSAYDDFCTAIRTATEEDLPLLLVDSEAPVAERHERDGNFDPWGHLHSRDGWEKPGHADADQAHLMVQCMEAWFLADRASLDDFFGVRFHEASLPSTPNIEKISKENVFNGLKNATRRSAKGPYEKGAHSFKILEEINPGLVFAASPWAQRIRDTLRGNL